MLPDYTQLHLKHQGSKQLRKVTWFSTLPTETNIIGGN